MGLGTGLPVVMAPSELAKLIGVIYHDTQCGPELESRHPGLWQQINPGSDYYTLPEAWFLQDIELAPEEHVALLQTGQAQIEDLQHLPPLPERVAQTAPQVRDDPVGTAPADDDPGVATRPHRVRPP